MYVLSPPCFERNGSCQHVDVVTERALFLWLNLSISPSPMLSKWKWNPFESEEIVSPRMDHEGVPWDPRDPKIVPLGIQGEKEDSTPLPLAQE